MKNIAVITCGRSDFSIYLPLLKFIEKDHRFNLFILVSGSHLERKYGLTIKDILKHKFKNVLQVNSLVNDDSPYGISKSMAKTMRNFSEIYKNNKFDFLIALGDRYEMFSAVSASIAFNIPIAHLHGGETTLGAIDEYFRHSITIMSKLHFTSCAEHSSKVSQILDRKKSKNIFNIGSLSFHNKNLFKTLPKKEIQTIFNLKKNENYILVTIHPETINTEKNKKLVTNSLSALKEISVKKILSLPNNDTYNNFFRNSMKKLKQRDDFFVCENLGPELYMSAIKHCLCMVGNSSSGIIESARFHKYAVNIGDRQKGRIHNKNLINTSYDTDSIINSVNLAIKKGNYSGKDKFYKPNALNIIIKALAKELNV